MTKPIIKIHNIETNEIIEREMTTEELLEYENNKLEIETTEAAKAAEKQAILDKLGITAEQAKLLLS
jgi:hypothetical protein